MTQTITKPTPVLEDSHKISKSIEIVLLTLIGILVYSLAGYNYFMDSSTRLIFKITVPIILAGILTIQKTRGNIKWFSITFSFFSISIGFLAAYFLGTWYELIPGLSLDSVQGVAIAKFAEVLPIVISVIVLGYMNKEDLTSLKIKGGDTKLSIRLGVYAIPLSYVTFLLMGGTIITMAGNEFLSIIPWLLLFALSNAFMEELIFRGAFLDKLEAVLGNRLALIQTSVIFAIFHISILQATGFEMMFAFTGFIIVLGLAWGYIVQKSNSIWGAVFAHAIADIFVILIGFGLV